MRPAAVSLATFSLLIWLQTLRGLRGLYRCKNERSSRDLRMPLIQPQHSATSSACATVTDGKPESFLWTLSHISVSRAWCAASQVSKSASVQKLFIFLGFGTMGDARQTLRERQPQDRDDNAHDNQREHGKENQGQCQNRR